MLSLSPSRRTVGFRMADFFLKKMTAAASSYLPMAMGNSAHRPMGGHPGYPGYPPMGGHPGYPGYPPMGQPGYPPMGQPGYPPMGQPGQPPMAPPGYPPVPPPGYPPVANPAYPPTAYPPVANPALLRPENQTNPPVTNATNSSTEKTEANQTPANAVNQPTNYPMNPPPVMAQAVANQVVVIGSQFCSPYPVDLTISRKLSISEGNFGVTDIYGNIMFSIKGKMFSIRDRRVLLDSYGNALVSLQQKIMTAHRRWQVFRGDSNDSKNLVFSVKKSSLIQLMGTGLEVFLATNTSESSYDFKVKGSYMERSCTIYASNGATCVAQMHRKHSVESILFGKDTFAVTVYPNIDYAFIVALVVILEEINQDRNGQD